MTEQQSDDDDELERDRPADEPDADDGDDVPTPKNDTVPE